MEIENKYDKLMYWFKEISKVPRNSKKEEKIANYLCDFAKNKNLEYKKDALNNVLIIKKASKGFENKESIILQAHTDMVCEKIVGSTHDFEKEPIEIIEKDDTFQANGTTLGADDGIGVATLLLMLDDNEIEKPELYCLFTTQEEIGMGGAKNFDYSGINAKYLINVDNEEENTAIVGCAGGVRVCYSKELSKSKTNGNVYSMSISGLYGGHSGVDINKGRINANYLAGIILTKMQNVQIISFEGGNKYNAIPNNVTILFSTTSTNLEDIVDKAISNIKIYEDDKNLKININNESNNELAISQKDTEEFLNMILTLKQGVIGYIEGRMNEVETSGNVGIVSLKNGKAEIFELIRSADDNKKNEIKNINNTIAQKYGYNIEEDSSYPGWKYKLGTYIEKEYIESYKQTHDNEEPKVCAIHAGVECSIIYEKMPELEMISIGPTLVDVHTVNETLYLDSCKKFIETFIELIKRLGK